MSRDDAERLAQWQHEQRPDTSRAGVILACVAFAALLWIAGLAWFVKAVTFAVAHPDATRYVVTVGGIAVIAGALAWIDWQTTKMTRDHAEQVQGVEP